MNSLMRSAMIGMLLVLPVAVAYSSGSSSSYGSASASASAAAGGSSAAAGTVTKQVIESTVSLAGVSPEMFSATTTAGKAARKAFKTTVTKGLTACGTDGTKQCTADDVVIVSVGAARRAGTKIDFYIKVANKAKADAGAKTLATFLANTDAKTGFAATLVAEAKKDPAAAATLGKVDATTIKVTINKAPVANTKAIPVPTPTPTTVGSVAREASISLASMAFLCLALRQ